MRRLLLLAGAVGWGMLGLLAGRGLAQPPQFTPANAPPGAVAGSEVDITAPYAVTAQAGEWMICAHSYMGPNAPTLARQLVEEIRQKQHMPAYILNRANEERRRMQEEYERVCRACQEQGVPRPRRRISRVEEQCAVLIGGPGAGWSSCDDASSFLKKVRQWPLPVLRLDNGAPAYDMKLVTDKNGHIKPDGEPINPFLHSFVTRNPTAPPPKPQSKFDPFWTTLNAHEDYSLLKCPQPWTLVVKEYIGGAVVTPSTGSSNFLDKLNFFGHKEGEGITAAGQQAHALAEFLTKLGFKSYVLHTRTSSVVTVGAFRDLRDPELARTQDRLAHLSFKDGKGLPFNIGLFQHPLPMEVPHP